MIVLSVLELNSTEVNAMGIIKNDNKALLQTIWFMLLRTLPSSDYGLRLLSFWQL